MSIAKASLSAMLATLSFSTMVRLFIVNPA